MVHAEVVAPTVIISIQRSVDALNACILVCLAQLEINVHHVHLHQCSAILCVLVQIVQEDIMILA